MSRKLTNAAYFEWEEDKHPRGEGGRWASSGGESGGTATAEPTAKGKGGKSKDEAGGSSDAVAKAYQFFSPNVAENMNFQEAHTALKSTNQAHFKTISNDILKTVGLGNNKAHDAIGDWSDGAENSVVQEINNPKDFDTVKYAASWMGRLAKQKAVLAFMGDKNGKDSVYETELPEKDVQKLRSVLSEKGIAFRSIIPTAKGHRVIVFDEGGAIRNNMAAVGDHYDAEIHETKGRGEFIGSGTRTGADKAYREVIDQHEKDPVRAKYKPQGAHFDWRSADGEALDRREIILFNGEPQPRSWAVAEMEQVGVPQSFIQKVMDEAVKWDGTPRKKKI